MNSQSAHGDRSDSGSIASIFLIFLRLGLTSFGGPVAHIAYFRDEFVRRRRWLDESAYADLVALCQFLPGPASSQVGMALGLMRGGQAGAIAAWLGFTMPSALLMIGFGVGLVAFGEAMPAGLLQGLKLAAVAAVIHAAWGMGRTLCADRARFSLMVLACGAVLLGPAGGGPWWVIVIAALLGPLLLPVAPVAPAPVSLVAGASGPLRPAVALAAGAVFLVLLIGLPFVVGGSDSVWLAQFDAFYRAGSLVFGGGQVVLPMLQAELVDAGLVNERAFLAGYGAAQAIPGPLFTFAGFLGAAMQSGPGGWLGGLWCLVAIFVPAWLLVLAALPFWARLRQVARAQQMLAAVNAAVVGVLLAALYDPVWTGSVLSALDFCFVLAGVAALAFWRVPQWLTVVGGALTYAAAHSWLAG
jgi:chromate transporter